MQANGFRMGVLAVVIVGLVSLVPYVGWFLIAPIVALMIGAAAGRQAAAATRSGTTGAGAKAGAKVGVGALIGSIIGVTILGLVLVNIPGAPEFIRSSEPHPEARIPYEWMTGLGALTGVVVGFFVGLFDLFLSFVGGLLAAWVYDHNRRVPA